jgi:hypothetical protein
MAQGGNIGGFGTLGGVEPTGQYPSPQYYLALEIYRSGDLGEAIVAMEDALRSGRRDIRGRWIDSIPALAMMAECHWQLGNIPAAKEYIDQVFQIAITNRGWLGRVDWQSAVQPGVQLSPPSYLWAEAAAVRRVPVSDKVMFRAGQPLSEAVLRRGGEIQEQTVRTMDIVEIARGLAIASYRRRILLGPLSGQDPLGSELLEAIKYPADLQLPLGKTLIGSMRTTAHFSSLDDKQTIEVASQNAMFSGAAHPLSAITLLAQLSAMAGAETTDSVAPLALSTANIAAALKQPEFLGEAMQLAAGCCNAQQASAVRQAATTVAGAMLRESPLASLHCLIAGADASITAGDLESAATLLAQAQSLGSRRDVTLPRMNAYGAWVSARLAAARGSSAGIAQSTDFDKAILQMTGFALNHRVRAQSLVSMPRVFQMALIRQSIGANFGGNTGDQLLRAYSADPPIDVWRRDPVDALAGVLIDRSAAYLARVQLAGSVGEADPLLVAGDAMLAARFQQRLPLGGRIAQVRALAGTDDSLLDPAVVELRNKLGRDMSELRAAALAGGVDPAQNDALEAKACAIAVSRVALPRISPPVLDEKLPVAKLPARTGLLTFINAGNQLYAAFAADGKVSTWTIAGANRLPNEVAQLLREIGVGKARGNRLPENDSWREAASKLRSRLIPDDQQLSAERFDELIVVPDGPLWYLPFEILPVSDSQSPLLGDQLAVRYAPTPGLAIKTTALPADNPTIGLSAELFFAPRDPEQNETMIKSLLDVIGQPVRLPQTPMIPTSLLEANVGHLVIAATRSSEKDTLLTSIATYDRDSPYGTLAAWMRFPLQVPRSVVLFGMRTPVDQGQMGSGEEIFMTLCALHVSGVRSVLLSRWAVGGESSAIALRELVQELPFAGLNSSWARARSVLRQSELNPESEPLLIKSEHARQGLTGDQPLFWAGYLLSSPPQPQAEIAP